ncbi:hypothetical protein M758_9G156400 [Ceratodon purpureus]|nr:hypothetical protein M758_9G156400 [Ceratodon purpureus]
MLQWIKLCRNETKTGMHTKTRCHSMMISMVRLHQKTLGHNWIFDTSFHIPKLWVEVQGASSSSPRVCQFSASQFHRSSDWEKGDTTEGYQLSTSMIQFYFHILL